ncbi:AAA family ATPase [Nonomuraea sp. K274]|uniref:AAA family ATPase n=1 Tax=Nonomuraea cypriaca TaxID=1187855 RepID=A0A931F416_9ACTN|nr:helix-turn-helix transcriptional regulator [Nonomuraea cypriaca]MBF8190686.1 AAA family ATPase [Nonomuraea cypriaca]
MFVGREAELAVLAAARARTPCAVVVAGEAGIGKSRLVGEFVSRADALVLKGAADPGGPAYAPLVTVLRRLVRELGVRQVAELLPGGGRMALARLLPELGQPPEPDRARLFEEILLLLELAAEQREIVLVLEDLHWAHAPARDLLVFLLRNILQPGVLVIGTSRATRRLWPLLRLDNVELLTPPPMGREEVARMLGCPAASAEVEHILRRSEGNPLFVEALADAGTATPGQLLDLLLAGAERLAPASLGLLRAAAVAGRRVEHTLLRAVTDLNDLALDEALRPIVRRRLLLVDGDCYVFRHTLIREAVYDNLLPGERNRLHTRCAAALADQPERASDHWYAAGDRKRAAETAWQAKRYERVLELWAGPAMDGADHARVLELAAETALHAGAAERAEALATSALREVDTARAPERAAHLLTLRVAARDQLGEDGLDDLREAVRLAPGSPRLIGALATSLAWHGRHDEARMYAEQASEQGDTRSLIILATLAAVDGAMDVASAIFARARAEASDDDTVLTAIAGEADALEAAGKHTEAAAVAHRGMAQARSMGRARSRGALIAANLAEPLASLGRWQEARQVVAAALALDPPPLYRAWLLMVAGTVAVWEGDLAVAADAVCQARPLMRGRSRGEDSCLEPDLLECRLAQVEGDADRVHRLIGHVLAAHDLSQSHRYAWPLLTIAIQASVRLSLPLDRIPATGRLQQAHRATFDAELDGGSWEQAVARWRSVGQPHALGQALLRAGEHALRAGDRRTARARLRESASIAASLAARPLSRQIEMITTAGKVDLARDASLSVREIEVLGLVAEGLSNRQIAERLFISPRTSGVHVSNILAKLGVSTRIEAATVARRRGLL